MTARAKRWVGEGREGVNFFCPGCGIVHSIKYAPAGWSFNGDFEKPTITPSVLVQGHRLTRDETGKWSGGYEKDASGKPIPEVCHSFVTAGRIQFLGDSTHALAGQTVDLPPWPYGEGQ